jgi:hypothetical protein
MFPLKKWGVRQRAVLLKAYFNQELSPSAEFVQ